MAELHQSIRAITQIRGLRQLLVSQQDFFKKTANSPLTSDEILIYQSTEQKMAEYFNTNLLLLKNSPEALKLVSDAQKILVPLYEQVQQATSREKKLKISPLIVNQYMLEAQDLLGKVQLVLANESDRIFNGLYSVRFTPLYIGLMLTLFFLLFAAWIGYIIKSTITEPIIQLVDATDEFANGNLKARAPIAEANEVGAVANAFNMMAHKIEEGINERQNAARDLLEAKEAAEAASQTKSSFLANMSHEIRTPLGAVLGFSELITDPQASATEKSDYVLAIKRNGELLSNIINDILDLSKIEAGKMKVELRQITLAEILNDVQTLLNLQAKEKGIELAFHLIPEVPKVITTDPLRLKQVLINIIGNAIKFTAKGSVEIKIELKSLEAGTPMIIFTIKDSGSGIAQSQINKLFAPFSQADNTSKRQFGGTGLGLILSKRFAQMLGGDVTLSESNLGLGSTFQIMINPGPTSSVTDESSKQKMAESKSQSLFLGNVKVLLVEDSADNQILITHFLTRAGAFVEIASNGREAIEKIKNNIYSVVLMDIQMPVMDGFEATTQLRADGYKGKIIALTAHALADERERCLRSGFDDHISKPVNRNRLLEQVKHFSQ